MADADASDDDPIIAKSTRLPKSMWSDIARYQRGKRIKTESEALRRLLQKALEQELKP